MKFSITEPAEQTHPQWRSFVLQVDGNKRRFHLGWNGQRFARDTGLRNLCDRCPQVAEDVCAWAESGKGNCGGIEGNN